MTTNRNKRTRTRRTSRHRHEHAPNSTAGQGPPAASFSKSGWEERNAADSDLGRSGNAMTDNRPRLTGETFDRLVEQAIARIPADIRRHLDNVVITVLPRPGAEMLAELGCGAGETLFGLYWGVPLTERSLVDPPLFPDTIYIFQEPLEAFCQSHEELMDEIEITVVHEIAHFLGFGEGELAALGYG